MGVEQLSIEQLSMVVWLYGVIEIMNDMKCI